MNAVVTESKDADTAAIRFQQTGVNVRSEPSTTQQNGAREVAVVGGQSSPGANSALIHNLDTRLTDDDLSDASLTSGPSTALLAAVHEPTTIAHHLAVAQLTGSVPQSPVGVATPAQALDLAGTNAGPASTHGAALAAASASISAVNQPPHQLTELNETIALVSRQSGLSAAAHQAPAQRQINPAASQNWATYVTQTPTVATGRATTVDSNGFVYVTGATDEGTTKKAFVAEYDATGVQVFITTFQATDVSTGINYNHTEAHGIALDGNGNIYITGQATNPSSRRLDAFVMRFDLNGKVDTTYGVGIDSGGLGDVVGNGIAVTPDGTATLVGTARFLGNDIFIAQVAANGSVNYGNAFPSADFPDANFNAVFASGIALSPDGSIAYISATGTHPGPDSDITVMYVDMATGGNLLSGGQAGYSYNQNPGADNGGGIVVGADGTVYQTGTVTAQSNGQPGTFAAAISWSADLSTTAYVVYDADSTTGTGIAVDPAGNIYLTGTAADILAVPRALVDKLDSTGAIADTLLIVDNGSGQEAGWGIAYSSSSDTVFVAGDTSSSNLATDATSLNGSQDAFLANVGNFLN
jgi:hypothetical protein